MTFIKGDKVELRVLDYSEAAPFTAAVNAGLTTEHLFTGSIPMRAEDYGKKWIEEKAAGDILFGVWTDYGEALKKTFIGTCGLHSHRDIYRSWEARFLLYDPDAVGKGLGTEVVQLLCGYGFGRLNAHRIWLGVSEDNKRAVKCYLSVGFVFEGRLRDEIWYRGRYHAALRMSILEDEWRSIAQSS